MSTYSVDIRDSTDKIVFVKGGARFSRKGSQPDAGACHGWNGSCIYRWRLLWLLNMSIAERSSQMLQPRSRSAACVTALILVALALVAGLLPLRAGPVMAQDETAEADATLRVVHASPGSPEL